MTVHGLTPGGQRLRRQFGCAGVRCVAIEEPFQHRGDLLDREPRANLRARVSRGTVTIRHSGDEVTSRRFAREPVDRVLIWQPATDMRRTALRRTADHPMPVLGGHARNSRPAELAGGRAAAGPGPVARPSPDMTTVPLIRPNST